MSERTGDPAEPAPPPVASLPVRIPGQSTAGAPTWSAFTPSSERAKAREVEAAEPMARATASVSRNGAVTADDVANAVAVDANAARSRVYRGDGLGPTIGHRVPPELTDLSELTDPPQLTDHPQPADPLKLTDPPDPARPPEPVEPPEPIEPPEPPQPPTPQPEPEHPEPPPPVPVPPPPPSPAPEPVPQPVPHPPTPEPIPPTPPAPPLPPPLPSPPGPVPPPPSITPATPAPTAAGPMTGRVAPVGVPTPRADLPAPRTRTQGTVYGRPAGWPGAGAVPGHQPQAQAPHAGQVPGTPGQAGQARVTPVPATHAHSLEHSGSLTGQILAQGQPAELPYEQQRNRTVKTAFLMGAMLGVIVIIGVVIAYLAGDFIRTLTDG